MKMKKGQVQMQETILVLFIFTVMLLVGFIIFYRYTIASINNENEKNNLVRFYDSIGYLPSLPEIKCSNLGQESECIDAMKLLAYKDVNKDLGYLNITVYVVYPDSNSNECKDSINNCGVYEVYSSKPTIYSNTFITSTPVSLYYADTKEYKIGKMVLETYY